MNLQFHKTVLLVLSSQNNWQRTSVTHHLYVHTSDVLVPFIFERLACSWWHASQRVMLYVLRKYRKYRDIVSLTAVTSHCLPGPVTYITKENFIMQWAGSLNMRHFCKPKEYSSSTIFKHSVWTHNINCSTIKCNMWNCQTANWTNSMLTVQVRGKAVPLQAEQALRVPAGWVDRLQDSRHMKAGGLSALFTGHLHTQKIFLVLISVRGWVNPRPILRPEGLCHWKIPMTPKHFK
jgi:hypothetical protein